MGSTPRQAVFTVNAAPTQLPPEFARHWARELGSKESTLVRLQGGINNHVYRCGDRRFWVIKGYAPLEPGLRDRMQAEVEFLRYAAHAAPSFTPELIHEDLSRRCVVLEHLKGEEFPEGVSPPPEAVDAAVLFFRCLNEDHSAARQAIGLDASEGFLSLTEHLDNIEQRILKMGCDHLSSEIKQKAELLFCSLQKEFEYVHFSINQQINSGVLNNSITPEECHVSPGDFGFHNAIQTDAGLKFIDFEFSGWDDPVKTLLDFILQPRVPFIGGRSPLRASLKVNQPFDIERRYQALMPILRLKWACIILSVLNYYRLVEMSHIISKQSVASLISQRIDTAFNFTKKFSNHLITLD